MNTAYSPTPSRRRGFSLVEMIGVLAIIAILAVVIVPKVFSTISSSRVTSTVGSINTLKTAIAEFAAKYGTIPGTGTNARIDDLLIKANMLESRFTTKLGTQPPTPLVAGATWTFANNAWTSTGGASQSGQSRVVCYTATAATPGSGTNYFLDGSTALPTGSRVVSVIVAGIPATEARELSARIDGESLSQSTATTADTTGKVTYATPNSSGITNVFVYLAHQ